MRAPNQQAYKKRFYVQQKDMCVTNNRKCGKWKEKCGRFSLMLDGAFTTDSS